MAANTDLLAQLYKASEVKDAPKLLSLLGARPALMCNTIDDPLLTLPTQDIVLSLETSQQQQQLLGALLCCAPSAYELPWILITRIILQDQISLSFVQQFLQSATMAWCQFEQKHLREPRRKPPPKHTVTNDTEQQATSRTARNYILVLLENCMKQLRPVETTTTTTQAFSQSSTITCELLSYVVAMVHDMGELSLSRECLGQIIPKKTEVSNNTLSLVPWMKMISSGLRHTLRHSDWQVVRQILLRRRQQQQQGVGSVSLAELPEIVKDTLVCAMHSMVDPIVNTEASNEALVEWLEILVSILQCAYVDLSVASLVDESLRKQLMNASSPDLVQLATALLRISVISESSDDTNTNDAVLIAAIHCNILLFILQASRQSGSEQVAQMVARALNKSKPQDLHNVCWSGLVVRTLGRKPKRLKQGLIKKTNVVDDTKSVLDGILYTGEGNFVDRNQKPIYSASHVGSIVYESLFIRHRGLESSAMKDVYDKALSWTYVSMHVIEQSTEGEESYDVIVAVLVLIVIYCELPMSRKSLVQGILETFDGNKAFGRRLDEKSVLFCLILSLMISSPCTTIHNDLDELASILKRPIIFPVFMQFATCLSSVPAVREALLATARRELDMSIYHQVAEVKPVSSRRIVGRQDSLHGGLFALVLLLESSKDWDALEVEAWAILSDVIVSCNPALPLSSRSWLFNLLADSSSGRNFSGDATRNLLAAVLYRLLYFIGTNEDGQESFIAARAIFSYCDTENSNVVLSTIVEDISGLLSLALSLCHVIASGNKDDGLIISNWRLRMQAMIRGGSLTRMEDHKAESKGRVSQTEGLPLVHGTFVCCAMILRNVVGADRQPFQSSGCSELSSQILMHSQQILAHSSSLPMWLQEKSHIIGMDQVNLQGPNRQSLLSLNSSLNDAIIDVLIADRWDKFLTADSRGLATTPESYRELLLGVGKLFQSTQDSDNHESASKRGTKAKFETFKAFSKLLVPALDDCLSGNVPQTVTKSVLDTTIGFCDVLANVLDAHKAEETETAGYRDFATRVWKVYSSLCDEAAALRLRKYYDSALIQNEQPCLTDADLLIRNFRFSVIRLMAKSIPLAYGLPSDSKREKIQLSLGNLSDGSSPIPILARVIDTVSFDLAEGLEGNSGMIDYDLFGAYIDCIQESIHEILQQLALHNEQGETRLLVSICLEASKNLEKVVCCYTLRQFSIFKTCLVLALYNLPSVARSAMRHLRLNGDKDFSDPKLGSDESDFCLLSLAQCIAIRDRMDANQHWDDIVGWKHNLTSVTEDDIAEEGPPTRRRFLQLGSERNWVWAFCASLECFEYLWEESLLCFHDSSVAFPSSISAVLYMKARHKDLTAAWDSLVPLLVRKGPEKQETFTGLPSQIKLRLGALLDRIVRVEQRSVKTLAVCIQKGLSKSGMRRLDFLESLNVVSVWLKSTQYNDILAHAAFWYSIETEHAQKIASAMLRVDNLEESLRKLYQILQKHQDSECLKSIDGLFSSIHYSNGSDYTETEGQLLQLVNSKWKAIECRYHSLSEAELAKRRAEEAEISLRARKERKKKVFRSRNQVVDEFFHRDVEGSLFHIEQSGFDDAFDDDSFTELEDFLVDG